MYVRHELQPKKFEENEGRVLVVKINVDKKKILLVGIQTPNGVKEKSLKIKQKLDCEIYDQMMLMGDFNGAVNSKIDKTPKKRGGKLSSFFFF